MAAYVLSPEQWKELSQDGQPLRRRISRVYYEAHTPGAFNILFQTFLRVMPFSPLTASAVFFIFTSFFLLVLFKFFFRRLVSALTAGWLMKLVTRIRTECDYVAGPQLAP